MSFLRRLESMRMPIGLLGGAALSRKSAPSGETVGRLNSEDTQMEVAHGEKLRMKYFHLQASDLQKRL